MFWNQKKKSIVEKNCKKYPITDHKAAEVFVVIDTGKYECQSCGYVNSFEAGNTKKGRQPSIDNLAFDFNIFFNNRPKVSSSRRNPLTITTITESNEVSEIIFAYDYVLKLIL